MLSNEHMTKEEVVNKYLDIHIDCAWRVYQTDFQKEHITEENGGYMFDVTYEFEHHKFIRTIFYDSCALLGYNTLNTVEVVDNHGVATDLR